MKELMQQALDLLDDINQCSLPPTGIPLPAEIDHVMEALRARLAQPEQEPVAWMYDWYDETEDIDGVPIGGIVHDWISKDYDEAHSPTMGCHNIRPLYTAPPQREFIVDDVGDKFAHSLAVMLECALLSPEKTWDEAHALLDEYREAIRQRDHAMGIPYVSGFGKD